MGQAKHSKKEGRGKRSPARATYSAANHKERNARLRKEKEERKAKQRAAFPPRVPRGTARNKRRKDKQAAWAERNPIAATDGVEQVVVLGQVVA